MRMAGTPSYTGTRSSSRSLGSFWERSKWLAARNTPSHSYPAAQLSTASKPLRFRQGVSN